MWANFAIPHAASVKAATFATFRRSTTFAFLLRRNLRPGALAAHYSCVRKASQPSARTTCSPSAPCTIPASSTFSSYTTRSTIPTRTILVQRRHCSYQRNMCRQHFGTDVAESHIDVSKGREVLPKNVNPLHYRITLEPNLETFEFDGQVDIE